MENNPVTYLLETAKAVKRDAGQGVANLFENGVFDHIETIKGNPITYLFEAVEAVKRGAGQGVADWFENGVLYYLETGESLCKCLQLNTGGKDHGYRLRYLVLQRNDHLKKAFKLCVGVKPSTKAKELEKKVKDFEARLWPLFKKMDSPPERLDDLNRALFFAFKVGEYAPCKNGNVVPVSWSQLLGICDV